MGSATCIRCGRKSECEYGADGLPYCSSCSFYGLNRQCGRCRMYLPYSELQQYRGQWACPYCIQDMRDSDRRAEERPAERPRVEVAAIPEQCDRCGRDLQGMVYIWNDRKLCKPCMEDEQDKWGLVGGGPMGAPYRVSLKPERRRKRMSILERLFGDFLRLFGIRPKGEEIEIVVVGERMPIGLAKPMSEKPMSEKPAKQKEDPSKRPQSEGLMRMRPAGKAAAVPVKVEPKAPPRKRGRRSKKPKKEGEE